MLYIRNQIDIYHSAAQTCADPVLNDHRDHVRKRRQNGIDSASTKAPSRTVNSSSGGVPHRIGSPVQGREGRAEAWGAQFPERGASVLRRKASQLAYLPLFRT